MDDVRWLSPIGRIARLAACAAVLAALGYGSYRGSDDHFPFGPMTQYAFAANPDGSIPDHYVEADTAAGRRIRVRLSSSGVGIARAEIEGQLREILADPSRLQVIADAQRRLHPRQPRFTRLYLKVRRIHLRRGIAVRESVETLAEWGVR